MTNRWAELKMNLELLLYLTIAATFGAVGVGVWWVVVGAFEGEIGDSYLSTEVIHDVRGAGAILIALGLLIGPVAVAVLLALRAYADERT
jgi:hypothetical protein